MAHKAYAHRWERLRICCTNRHFVPVLRTVLLQIVVFDKLEYCGTLNNLSAISDRPNYKVTPWTALHIMMPARPEWPYD